MSDTSISSAALLTPKTETFLLPPPPLFTLKAQAPINDPSSSKAQLRLTLPAAPPSPPSSSSARSIRSGTTEEEGQLIDRATILAIRLIELSWMIGPADIESVQQVGMLRFIAGEG